MKIEAEFPTTEHEKASNVIVDHFSTQEEVEAVILYGSCARGQATKDSCLDIMVMVPPSNLVSGKAKLEGKWQSFYETEDAFRRLLKIGRYSHVDMTYIDGNFEPKGHYWTTGPDEFELEIGNTLVYSVALWQSGDRLEDLKSQWLPYYNDGLRSERLQMVLKFCRNNLDHIPLFLERKLYFQAFDRFYNAFQEFLQALFISHRTYPIAYDKWIKEQLEDILGMPDLHASIVELFEMKSLVGDDIERKTKDLDLLLSTYIKE
jgi:predicted nucleotidyltransferase